MEKSGESMMTDVPQINKKAKKGKIGSEKAMGKSKQQQPEIPMANFAMRLGPNLSDKKPPIMQAIAPMPSTTNEYREVLICVACARP